jgi:aldehyde:ferredoxin oxidoreductase
MPDNGYAGRILRVDLTSGHVSQLETSEYADRFIGGRGVSARIYWDETPTGCDAFDPGNRLIFMTGPLCGVPGFASRFQVCGKSAITNTFSYCNMGGSWGAYLKRAGYDGVVVSGRASDPVYLWVDNDKVELRDAASLKGMSTFSCEKALKDWLGQSVRVLTIGPAGENRVVFATLVSSENSCGTGGLAAVMGSKNLKAIAVRGEGKVGVADAGRLADLRAGIARMRSGLPDSMRDLGWLVPFEGLKPSPCHACPTGCVRMTYRKPDGAERKFMCQAAIFYQTRAERYYGQAADAPFRATEVCDEYGVDTRAIETMIMWLSRCYHSGILTEERTGLPLSKIGSREFIEALLHKVAFREGFGDVLAHGTVKASEMVGQDTDRFITDYMIDTGENEVYGPRLYLTTGLLYAMEPRMPIQQLHEISVVSMQWAARELGLADNYLTSEVLRGIGARFWGSELAADFSTYDAKAPAAVRIQDRQYAKEALILCDFSWPIIHSPATPDHVGDPTMESKVCEAVTGMDLDETGLYRFGERIFNLQRAILVREGQRGRDYDSLAEFCYTVPLKGDYGNPECLVPGKDGKPFSRKGMVVDRDAFEKMKDEFYRLRGWDVATGLQRRETLESLGLADVADSLALEGLLA